METIVVETKNGEKEEIVYNVKDFPYNSFLESKTVRKRKVEYLNIVSAFDIETTTIRKRKTDKIKKESLDDGDYYGEGFMYHWQFCIEDAVVFGRTWEEFVMLLNYLEIKLYLSSKRRLVIFVHNLGFEFQFMKEFLTDIKTFSKESRKPMKLTCNRDCFEFRCSYFLSNRSLLAFCESTPNCVYYKNIDTYDYTKIRTPLTPLTIEEKSYCYCDVRGLVECVKYRMESFGDNIATMPLTDTGYVRRECRRAMQSEEDRKLFKRLQLTLPQYKLCRDIFRGGDTHASRFYVGRVLENLDSYDRVSSYPHCCLVDYFPMSRFEKVEIHSKKQLEEIIDSKCLIFHAEFFDIKLKDYYSEPYIDIGHCTQRHGIENDNGRVMKADYISISLTEIDLKIINQEYSYSTLHITEAYTAERGRLPLSLRKKILQYYKAKTELKGIDGKEEEYMKSKNHINGIFGMMVSDILHKEIEYDPLQHEWIDNTAQETEEERIKREQAELQAYYNSRSSFLAYQWGIYVTAHARNYLHYFGTPMRKDFVYRDTDSRKLLNAYKYKEWIDKVNTEILNKNKQVELEDGLQTYAYKKNGERVDIGIWEHDATYEKFKTLGAKKYAYVEDGKFHITVSGMSKEKGAKQVGCIENFKTGKTFKNIGRTTSWFNESLPHTIKVTDYKGKSCKFTTASNIGILNTTYTLGVTNTYRELIKKIQPELLTDLI